VVVVAMALALAGIGLDRVSPGSAAAALLAAASVGLVVATPLLRVCWLIFRWIQERDLHFVAVGLVLLSIVITGAVLSFLGVGR
jgi:uncharacterized membrane protein